MPGPATGSGWGVALLGMADHSAVLIEGRSRSLIGSLNFPRIPFPAIREWLRIGHERNTTAIRPGLSTRTVYLLSATPVSRNHHYSGRVRLCGQCEPITVQYIGNGHTRASAPIFRPVSKRTLVTFYPQSWIRSATWISALGEVPLIGHGRPPFFLPLCAL